MRKTNSSLLKQLALSILFVAFLVTGIHAQPQPDPRVMPLVFTLPNTDKVTVTRDTVFKTEGTTSLKMDVYYPPNSKSERRPTVIFVNGVGAADLKDWKVYVDWAKVTAASGMIAITHQSRSADAASDTADLINYLRTNAATLKIDENKMGMWACSANVRVGLPLVTEQSRKYFRAAVMYYGVMASENVRFDLPMLIARAGQDVPNINGTIDAYVTRAIAQDAPLTLISYSDGQHAFDVLDNTDQSREIVRQTLDFLKYHLTRADDPANSVKRAPSPGRFVAMIATDGLSKALQAFEEGKKGNPNAVLYRENVLNAIGYQMLQDSRIREAVEIFKLNVAAYPLSANVYDSLGDGYEANGNIDLAIQNAEKALELVTKDTTLSEAAKAPIRSSAESKIQRLKVQNK